MEIIKKIQNKKRQPKGRCSTALHYPIRSDANLNGKRKGEGEQRQKVLTTITVRSWQTPTSSSGGFPILEKENRGGGEHRSEKKKGLKKGAYLRDYVILGNRNDRGIGKKGRKKGDEGSEPRGGEAWEGSLRLAGEPDKRGGR